MLSSPSLTVVAVHSPLVGPITVRPLAAALDARGWSTRVPDLRPALADRTRPFWRAYVDGATTSAADIVVGHSGAGAYLPLIADRLDARAVAYVDAVVPGDGSAFEPSSDLIRFLDERTDANGLLPPWPEWWPPSVMTDLVPELALRQRIVADAPRVPRRIYDEAVPLPDEWWRRPAVYLQLSEAYDAHGARAGRYRWPTQRLLGGHLDLATQPDSTASGIAELLSIVL